MTQTLLQLVATYGYAGVLLLIMLESMGLPLPGETALLTAAAVAATGRLSIMGVITAAAAGAIIGDAGGYWIGRKGGLALVRRYGRWLHVDDAKLARAELFYQRHGAKTIFFGRFVALLRMLAAVFAGVSRMPYGRFSFWNALGGISWATLVGGLGYLFGRNLPLLERALGRAGWLVALLVTVVIGSLLVGRAVSAHHTAVWQWWHNRWQRIVQVPMVQGLARRYPEAWAWTKARLSPGTYLGLHLTIGFGLSIVALSIFGALAEDVREREELVRFDLTLANTLHQSASATGITIFRAITELGSVVAMGTLGIGVALVLIVRKERLLLADWLIALGGGGVLNMVLKQIFQRARPQFATSFVMEPSWSFPSGHAMGSLIGYGMLAYLLVLVLNRRGEWLVILIATLLILLIGFSRLYLGAHYFSDVVAGYAAATVWLTTCITGLEVARRQQVKARMTMPTVRPAVQHHI